MGGIIIVLDKGNISIYIIGTVLTIGVFGGLATVCFISAERWSRPLNEIEGNMEIDFETSTIICETTEELLQLGMEFSKVGYEVKDEETQR